MARAGRRAARTYVRVAARALALGLGPARGGLAPGPAPGPGPGPGPGPARLPARNSSPVPQRGEPGPPACCRPAAGRSALEPAREAGAAPETSAPRGRPPDRPRRPPEAEAQLPARLRSSHGRPHARLVPQPADARSGPPRRRADQPGPSMRSRCGGEGGSVWRARGFGWFPSGSGERPGWRAGSRPHPRAQPRSGQTVRLARPLRRRAARMARPARVRIRSRKPWVFARRRLFGW